jgi:hypothetical protein
VSEFSLRPMCADDLGFIYKSWSKGVHASEPYKHIPEELFTPRQRQRMDVILGRATTLVVSPPGDSETILGWICFERVAGALLIHWTYVRNSARRGGIGCLLLAAAGWARGEAVVVPQWSKDMKWISERMDAVWDPWVAGA